MEMERIMSQLMECHISQNLNGTVNLNFKKSSGEMTPMEVINVNRLLSHFQHESELRYFMMRAFNEFQWKWKDNDT